MDSRKKPREVRMSPSSQERFFLTRDNRYVHVDGQSSMLVWRRGYPFVVYHKMPMGRRVEALQVA